MRVVRAEIYQSVIRMDDAEKRMPGGSSDLPAHITATSPRANFFVYRSCTSYVLLTSAQRMLIVTLSMPQLSSSSPSAQNESCSEEDVCGMV
jgi:hypothetical protein